MSMAVPETLLEIGQMKRIPGRSRRKVLKCEKEDEFLGSAVAPTPG
jgi:hypothetical protein